MRHDRGRQSGGARADHHDVGGVMPLHRLRGRRLRCGGRASAAAVAPPLSSTSRLLTVMVDPPLSRRPDFAGACGRRRWPAVLRVTGSLRSAANEGGTRPACDAAPLLNQLLGARQSDWRGERACAWTVTIWKGYWGVFPASSFGYSLQGFQQRGCFMASPGKRLARPTDARQDATREATCISRTRRSFHSP